MGLGASEVRLLQFTCRRNDLSRKMQGLSDQRKRLLDVSEEISLKYQKALCSKTLKWSIDSINYGDINYNTLMSPNSANKNKPVLISDESGRIVLNDYYKKYAEQISPNGAPGGDYQSHRTEFLASLTGISKEQLSASETTSADAAEKKQAMEDAKAERDKYLPESYEQDKFISTFLRANSLGIDSKVNSSNASSNASKIKNAFSGKNYFAADDFNNICDIIDNQIVKDFIDNETECDADEFIRTVTNAFASVLGGYIIFEDGRHNGTRAQYDAADAKYQAAEKAYKEAAGASNEVFTGTQDKQIAFYDQLFTAIAEQGWVNDNGVNDSEYLSQSLQNNSYYILNMEEDTSDNATGEYIYDIDLAVNYKNIFLVNDSDKREEAFVEYEHQKKLLSDKEEKIDTTMKRYETEMSAVMTMIESIEKVKNDNIEKFSIFS